MTTYSAYTTLTDPDAAQRLGLALENLNPEPTGIGVFEREDGSGLWEVAAYFIDPPDGIGLAILAAAQEAQDFIISEVPDEDWVAKVRRDLPPVAAGRFFVYGSHDADKVPAGSIPLLIEAAMAFGTGHHGTTLGCLTMLDRLMDDGHRFASVLDVGCGTAVLAMAATHASDATVLASDIDPVAVEVATANVAANKLEGRVECLVAAGLDAPDLRGRAPYDLIFANILKGPLIAISGDVAAMNAQDGFAILSGILNDQADEVSRVYSELGYNECAREVIGDWTTLLIQRI